MNDKIKMFIAGEEVVSNNDFTINEEMLSASSTILNNCYPKSWELIKDYVSNFYYPKDYSRFVLAQGEYEHGNDEFAVLTESGSNPSYETNVEKEWNSFNIYGRTYQETRSGINLLNVNATSTTTGGITFTVNDDKSITINGTNTSGSTIWYRIATNFTLEAGSYTLSNGTSSASYSTAIFYDDAHYFDTQLYSTKTFTSSVIIKPYIRVNSGAVLNNLTIYPMIVKGSYTSETMPPYEEYGIMPSPDYPSDLVSVGYQNLLDFSQIINNTNRGLTWNYENGKLNITGTASATYSQTNQFNINLPSGIYRFDFWGDTNLPYNIWLYNSSGTLIGNTKVNNPVSITETATKYALFVENLTVNTSYNDTITAQITNDVEKHSYIPYGKYGIEITNTGNNLLNLQNYLWAYFESSGSQIQSFSANSRNIVFYLKVEPNTSYVFKATTQNVGQIRVGFTEEAVVGATVSNVSNLDLTTLANTGYVLTSSATAKYLVVRMQTTVGHNIYINSLADYITNAIIEKGTTTSGIIYTPYTSNTQLYVLDEPLRAIGSYKDKLYTDGRVLYVERNIGGIILDGTNYSTGGTTGTNAYYIETNVSSLNNNNIIIGMSNMFAPVSFSNRANGLDVVYSQNGKVVLRTANNTSLNWNNATNRTNWLNENKPVVNYILATPTTTPLGYIDLPISYEGQNNVSIYTGLDARTELWYYWKNYDVLFAGVVKNSGDISLNPRHPHYCSLQILDYKTFLSESNTLDFVIANKTISEAIEMVVNAVSGYGFVIGNINIDSANDIIGAYSTLNKTAYDVLQYLAEISGSRWRARVVDSLTMAIDFYDPDTLPEADDIEYTKQYWEDNNIVDMTFNYGSRDYRNKQILLSNEVYGNIDYEETLISNGYGDTFTVQNNIGVLLNVIVDGDEKTIATINDKQMGIDADFYYTPGKNIIESNGVYSAGTMIRATYQPLVKGRQIVYNASEVERISNQTQTEGVIARYENRNDILSSEELQKIAQTYIDYKGKAEVIIKIKTQDNDLYDIGEVVYFNAPIDDLKQNYMVKAKDIEYIIIDKIIHLFYVYELTSSFNSEKAINYFDNQRNKASGNIAEGESITRNIDIETEVGIIWTDGSVSSTTITVDGDNVLNSVLNSPFVE